MVTLHASTANLQQPTTTPPRRADSSASHRLTVQGTERGFPTGSTSRDSGWNRTTSRSDPHCSRDEHARLGRLEARTYGRPAHASSTASYERNDARDDRPDRSKKEDRGHGRFDGAIVLIGGQRRDQEVTHDGHDKKADGCEEKDVNESTHSDAEVVRRIHTSKKPPAPEERTVKNRPCLQGHVLSMTGWT